MAKKENNELEKRNQAFLIYQDENGIARVNVRFDGMGIFCNFERFTLEGRLHLGTKNKCDSEDFD